PGRYPDTQGAPTRRRAARARRVGRPNASPTACALRGSTATCRHRPRPRPRTLTRPRRRTHRLPRLRPSRRGSPHRARTRRPRLPPHPPAGPTRGAGTPRRTSQARFVLPSTRIGRAALRARRPQRLRLHRRRRRNRPRPRATRPLRGGRPDRGRGRVLRRARPAPASPSLSNRTRHHPHPRYGLQPPGLQAIREGAVLPSTEAHHAPSDETHVGASGGVSSVSLVRLLGPPLLDDVIPGSPNPPRPLNLPRRYHASSANRRLDLMMRATTIAVCA